MSDEETAIFVKKTARRPVNLRKRALDELEDGVGATITKRTGPADTTEEETTSKIEKLDILYAASGTAAPAAPEQDMATATAEYDTSVDQDRTRIAAKLRATAAAKEGVDTEYRGQAGYRSFLPVHDTARANATSAKHRIAGPVRAAASIRMTSRFDYAPDLCKDYNETGFCGFGDSCKFVHDRGDYKSGWELEQEWEAQRALDGLPQPEPEDEAPVQERRAEGPPDACPICLAAFQKPVVVTKCSHYFCERCALRHAKDSARCFVCQSPVDGQFRVYKAAKPNL